MPQVISLIIFLFLFFLLAQIIKFALYSLYLWQIVEYRWDRFAQRMQNSGDRMEFVQYLNLANTNPANKYPKITLRIILTVFLLLFGYYQLLFLIYRPLIRLFGITDNFILTFVLLVFIFYYFTPLATSGITLVLNIAVSPFKWLIVYVARAKIRKYKNLTVIGVTGSYGKSSTKEVVALALAGRFTVCKTPVNNNTLLGVAKTILLSLRAKHQFFIVEMGAYKRGEIREICRLVKPHIGILTGISPQHLSLFGSLTNIIKTKYELISSLGRDGLALFNYKNEYCRRLYNKCRLKSKFYYGENSAPFTEALDAAMALSNKFKVPPATIGRLMPKMKKILEINRFYNHRNWLVMDDSYSSNPEGFLKAVEFVSAYKRKKLIVTPGIIELGSLSHDIHYRLGEMLGKTFDKIIITSTNFSKDLSLGVAQRADVLVSAKPVEIREWLRGTGKWLVLLEGRIPQNIKEIFTSNK